MKIRMGITLLAGMLFGLPPSIGAQTVTPPTVKVSSYYKWHEIHGAYWGCDPVAWTPDLYYEEHSLWWTPSYADTFDYRRWICTEGQPNEDYRFIVWPDGAQGPGYGHHYWYDWGDDYYEWAYFEEYFTRDPFGEPRPTVVYQHFYAEGTNQYGWGNTELYTEQTTYSLFTGGTPGVTKSNLLQVMYWAPFSEYHPEWATESNVIIWGRGFDRKNNRGDGVWYAMLPDHTETDVTPIAPGFNNILAGPRAEKLEPQIFWNGTNISGYTNVVWVGEKLDLECRLVGGGIYSPAITNYFWQVSGEKIKDWVLDGEGSNNISATVIPWSYLSNRNEAVTKFIWMRDFPQQMVRCTVKVEGYTLVAETTFEVRRPEATWYLTPRYGDVVVTTNIYTEGYYRGWYHLTTGLKRTDNDVGMWYEYYITDLKGFTNAYSVSMIQKIASDAKFNLNTGRSMQRHGSNLLDNTWSIGIPYWTWGHTNYGVTEDTPNTALHDSVNYHWRTDYFDSYLMWQSLRMPSIPVPLKRGYWTWRGQAQRLDTNTPPTWGLVTGWYPVVKPAAYTGMDVYSQPTWTNRMERMRWTFYETNFPTPPW